MVLGALSRRLFLVLLGGTLAACDAPEAQSITVYKDPYCGCCTAWVDHLHSAGFETKVIETADLASVRARFGIPDALASCHTGIINGYAIEGHVNAGDIKRLLKEKPDARGLAVPGMPIGSPGMETPDGAQEPYDVLLVKQDGTSSVFAHHP